MSFVLLQPSNSVLQVSEGNRRLGIDDSPERPLVQQIIWFTNVAGVANHEVAGEHKAAASKFDRK